MWIRTQDGDLIDAIEFGMYYSVTDGRYLIRTNGKVIGTFTTCEQMSKVMKMIEDCIATQQPYVLHIPDDVGEKNESV